MARSGLLLRRAKTGIATGPVPSIASVSSAAAGSLVSTLTVPIPTGTAAGDLMLLVTLVKSSTAAYTTPTGWTVAFTSAAANSISQVFYVRTATASESSAVLTWTGSAGRAVGRIFRITDTSGLGTQSEVKITSTNAQTIPAVTTTSPNNLLLALGMSGRGDTTLTLDSAMTAGALLASGGGSAAGDVQLLYATQSQAAQGSSGTRTVQASGATGSGVAGFLIPIKPVLL